MFKKAFKVQANWNKRDGVGGSNKKTHTVFIENKEPLTVSAAREFKGDGSKLNPEDLFLSALASCHMLSYMYVCQQNNITLLAYSDEVTGVLELNPDGSGAFKEIVLRPKVRILEPELCEKALELHKDAHRLCFIANSTQSPIVYNPIILKP